MVPLNAQPGDCYILATHPLREGELSLLARDLASARDLRSLLRTACSGPSGSGRVAIAALTGEHEMAIPAAEGGEPREMGPLELEPIEPGAAGGAPVEAETAAPTPAPMPAAPSEARAESLPPSAFFSDEGAESPAPAEAAPVRDLGLPPPPSTGGFVERRPWYEWVALWGG